MTTVEQEINKITNQKKVCHLCENTPAENFLYWKPACDNCYEDYKLKMQAEEKERKKKEHENKMSNRIKLWSQKAGFYSNFVESKLKLKAKKEFLKINSRINKNVIFYGNSGSGKTFLAYQLLKSYYLKTGRMFFKTTGYEIGSLSSNYNESIEKRERFQKKWCLFIDDLSKIKNNDSELNVLHHILEGRLHNKLPTVITCETTGKFEHFTNLFSTIFNKKNDINAILRRFSEYFIAIKL